MRTFLRMTTAMSMVRMAIDMMEIVRMEEIVVQRIKRRR